MNTETKILNAHMQELIDCQRDRNRHSTKVMFVQHLAMNALVAFYLIGSVVGFDKRLVSIGEVVFVMTAVTSIAGLTNSLGNTFVDSIYNLGLLREGLSILEDNPDVIEEKNARAQTINQGRIDVNKLSFSYPGSPVLFDNFSFSIQAKQKIEIVGSSGAGKTTLIKLLLRLYDPDKGEIQIDGVNLKRYTKKSLREQIAIVQ